MQFFYFLLSASKQSLNNGYEIQHKQKTIKSMKHKGHTDCSVVMPIIALYQGLLWLYLIRIWKKEMLKRSFTPVAYMPNKKNGQVN